MNSYVAYKFYSMWYGKQSSKMEMHTIKSPFGEEARIPENQGVTSKNTDVRPIKPFGGEKKVITQVPAAL